jgi:protein-disulfide isomerase
MSILYRIILILLLLAACYSITGIIHFRWMYHKVENPKAEFLVLETQNANATLVEFLNYGCGYCKELQPVIEDVLKMRKDLRYVARPIAFGEGATLRLTHIVLAAGLQDKFWEFHKAFLEYPEIEIPDSFIEETASLYGVDYSQLMKDADSEKVSKMAERNLSAMESAGLYGVPSFMINKKLYVIDESGVPDLKKMLEIVVQAQK